ncbi:conserved hypothetical protein [Vibrio nigripulchritudo MADA3029]|uniref:Lipoprotein n=2 Tax=Vibrio nigripulchritudo TaxID=28173 RepID=U4KH08_9VIBR|nr:MULTISPECIES: DUF3299 domain-containing protein [Vibrio]EGU61437.1 hypothetical protein VINI7043_14570 [Vibrio nigripulchritudo ATCC 27043]KJY75650.1 hypothetical protein TW74_16840 [Vibrio nigripulchritudo]UAB69998.1 DUF3299 domain-containing protein [Vibrio sp. SCSIO 43132]CCN38550.1 conserved hypothetical protein [Vibrio nigripulchritudo AM115]CCN42031.1 conserved hypothetical protein [Vibrio nigripulchritudo FTn2]
MKKILLLLCCWLGFLSPVQAEKVVVEKVSAETLTLDWIDLIPESERQQFTAGGMPVTDHTNANVQQSKVGSVRQELHGSQVKIPGFVIPLEGDDKKVTEFLLVPYFGACIHVPPPPPNQIIYVKFKEGAPIHQLWDVIYVVGTLKTETINSDLAETGYLIEGIKIEEYDDA